MEVESVETKEELELQPVETKEEEEVEEHKKKLRYDSVWWTNNPASLEYVSTAKEM